MAPTPAALKARFPAFAPVPDDAVAAALAEAEPRVDATWAAADRDPARMLYAAHLLTLDGFGGPEGVLAGALDLRALRSGALQIERHPPDATLPGTLGRTAYGRRFHELMLRNGPGIAVV
ncbi:MAG: DUF4054 domain-containing protein [Methylobacterium sp.]|uniref:DUF4054 domain-containing protein n=1 Tax=Methylobacterium sp. TaxID=409 RepID=UPI00258A62DD|nr:DUF4054 domain-containing protein [Methylobacterium sp.]MBY0299992.1 DUF4054 domain-containing protein [Methylobacterium sp.]